MPLTVKHRIVDVLRGAHHGVGVQEHGAKDGLLSLLRPRGAAFLERIASGRYSSSGNDETGHGAVVSALAGGDASRMRRASFTSSHVGRFQDSLRSNAAG